MTEVVRPMLAATYGEDKTKHVTELKFPYLASAKIDGIRALVVDGRVYSRSGKLIPHAKVQQLFGRIELNGLDGELAVGELTAPDLMQKTMGVMSDNDELKGDLTFNVFDRWDLQEPYEVRLAKAGQIVWQHGSTVNGLRLVPHSRIENESQLFLFEADTLAKGYEGVMLNRPDARYKNGRAGKTVKSELIKVKRFTDDEAVVIGWEEMMHNDNVAFKDELGRTKRATLQENMRPAGVLGSLTAKVLTGKFAGAQFNCSGFTAKEREDLFAIRDQLPGRVFTFKHFDVTGAVEAPRQPVFKSFRAEADR